MKNGAMCQEAGSCVGCVFNPTNSKPVTDLAFVVNNEAFRGVNVPVEVRIVGFFSSSDANPALNFLRNNPSIQKQMRDVSADLVTMFTGSVPADFPAAGRA
jgi:hypothetical protein